MSAVRNLIISAVSNLSTAYNLVVINIVHGTHLAPPRGEDNRMSAVHGARAAQS